MAHPENKEAKPITPRSGRVGNFLVNEEIIEKEDSEPLSRLHVSDCEHGWEVIIPQTYASAFNIVSLALDEEMNTDEVTSILSTIFNNYLLVTTCLNAELHSLVRDMALLGFTPAVNKASEKERKRMRKSINERLRSFEFPMYSVPNTKEEEKQEEIASEARDIIELSKE